jgi:hypothetical protein
MFMMRLLPDRLFPKQFLDLGEEVVLLIVMVRLHKLEPGLGIADKVSLVRVFNMRSLEVNGIKSSNDGIVQKRHVGGTCGEKVSLQRQKVSIGNDIQLQLLTFFVSY